MIRASLAIAAITLSGMAVAQEANVTMGRQIAEEYCATCHMVDPGGPFKQEPPALPLLLSTGRPSRSVHASCNRSIRICRAIVST